MVDRDLLRQRTEDAFRTNAGHVEGMKYPTPMDVLVDLQKYLKNSWSKDPRPISADNKRFVVRFGPEGTACKDILEKLHFRLEDQVGYFSHMDLRDTDGIVSLNDVGKFPNLTLTILNLSKTL